MIDHYKLKRDDLRTFPEHPFMLGMMERSLYTASWQFGKPEFIGFWLAVKVAGQWKVWAEGIGGNRSQSKSGENENSNADNTALISGRAIFNVFLIGSGFSIFYGSLGGRAIQWLIDRNCKPALIVPILLICSTAVFWLIARYWPKKGLTSNATGRAG